MLQERMYSQAVKMANSTDVFAVLANSIKLLIVLLKILAFKRCMSVI